MAARRRSRRFPGLALLMLLLPLLSGCSTQLNGRHYLPADTGIDPYSTVRARAEGYYESGLTHEQQGDWRKAVADYQQARLWDPDNRQDIKEALSHAQAKVDAQAPPPPTPAPTPQPVLPHPSEAQGPEQTPTPAPGATTPAPAAPNTQKTPQPTAPAAPAVAMRQFRSTHFPYSISYPTTWLAQDGGTEEEPTDTFVQRVSGSAALVMITAEQADSRLTLDLLYAGTVTALKAGGISNVQIVERRQVGAQPAYVLSYHATGDTGSVAVRHAIFVTPGMAWHVVLLATPTTTAAQLQIFDAMLDSLELQASAFPTQ